MQSVERAFSRSVDLIATAIVTVGVLGIGPLLIGLGAILGWRGHPAWGGVVAALGIFFLAVILLSKTAIWAITELSK